LCLSSKKSEDIEMLDGKAEFRGKRVWENKVKRALKLYLQFRTMTFFQGRAKFSRGAKTYYLPNRCL